MKTARFFCENCGAGVDRDSGRCPRCGSLFQSVRCPECGFTGAEKLFKDGCPVCGYCAPAPKEPDSPAKKSRALPAWVYAAALLGLAAAAAALFVRVWQR